MSKKITILLFLFPILIFAKKNKIEIIKNKIQTIDDIFVNSYINGYVYRFPEKIYTFGIDTMGFMSVLCRTISKNGKNWETKGNMFLYDLRKDSLRWKKKMKYNRDFFWHLNNKIIFNYQILNVENGKVAYKPLNNIQLVDSKHQIGVGYKFDNSQTLMATSLENGKTVWIKKISKLYNLNNLIYLNDSNVLIKSNGLHFIDIYTGKEWNFYAKNFRYSSIAYSNGTQGLFTGFFSISAATVEQRFQGIESNTLIDSNYIYIAFNDGISKIDVENGNIMWTAEFEKEVSSSSYLFEKEEYVYMINCGFAFMYGRPVYCGKAFIAGYHKNSGEQKFMHYFGNRDLIPDFLIKDNYLILNINNRLLKFDLEGNKILAEKTMLYSSSENTNLRFIQENWFFTKNANQFIDLTKTDTSKIFAKVEKGEIVQIDKDLKSEKWNNSNEFIFLNQYETSDFKFITDSKKTLMIDNEGNPIIEFDIISNVIVKDNVLYYSQDNSLYIIDLSDILK